MQRLDPKYSQLVSKQMATANLPPEEKTEVDKQVKEREAYLMPLYHQVAVHFADLHDTPERMLEKGCISVSTPYSYIFYDSLCSCNITIELNFLSRYNRTLFHGGSLVGSCSGG